MLNKFWLWLLGFKNEEGTGSDKSVGSAGGNAASSRDDSANDEGNFHNGTEGYQAGGYEGH
jgi:hypothetical protein